MTDPEKVFRFNFSLGLIRYCEIKANYYLGVGGLMKFFGFLFLSFALSFTLSSADAAIVSAQEGPVYECDDRDRGSDNRDLQITEGMLALVVRFETGHSFRYSRDMTKPETGYALFLSDSRSMPHLNVSQEILEGRQKGLVWEVESREAWDCEIKPPEPEPTNRFVKVQDFKENAEITNIVRLKDGRIVTVTTADFNLNIWTQNKFGFSKSLVLNGPTTYIEKVIELKNGNLASLSPRSGEVRVWTETTTGAYTSKTYDVGIDGKRVHSFLEAKNGTLVITNGTELVFLKPQPDGSYRLSRKALPVSGANDVFELSKGRLLVSWVLSGDNEALLLDPKGDDFEITTVKTPKTQNMRMLPSGQIASIVFDIYSSHYIEIWKSDFTVGGKNVERRLDQFYVSFRSLTELANGDIVFLDSDNTLRLWSKSTGLVEFLAKDVAAKYSPGGGNSWLPVITPNKSKPSFLFVDRDVVTVWEEQP